MRRQRGAQRSLLHMNNVFVKHQSREKPRLALQALPEDVWTPLRLLEAGELSQLQYQPMIWAVHSQQALVDDAVATLPVKALSGASSEAIRWAMSVRTVLLCPEPLLHVGLPCASLELQHLEEHGCRSCSHVLSAQQRSQAGWASACWCPWLTC